MFEFTTEVEIAIIGNTVENSGSGKAKVRWMLELEVREYGVKSFVIVVPDQTVELEVERYNFDTDEEYNEFVVLELKDVQVDSSFHHSSKDIKYLDLIPTELEKYGDRYELRF